MPSRGLIRQPYLCTATLTAAPIRPLVRYSEERLTPRSPQMSALALTLFVILAVATCAFYVAGGIYGQGSPWARDVCDLSRTLCDHPSWLAAATGVSAALYLVLRNMRY